MVCYGYDIEFDKVCTKSKSISLLESANISFKNFKYKLEFENNQNREVEVLSIFPIELSNKKQKYIFNIKELLYFYWEKESRQIFYCFRSKYNKKLLEYWTLHTLLPIYFTLENLYYFLHAGAVEVDNKIVLFTADSYGGKSTLTDFFINKHHKMISDDKVAVYEENNKIYATPSYSYHRPYRKTEDLGYFVENFFKKNDKIDKIYNLIKSNKESRVTITKKFGIEKFKVLRYSTDVDLYINKVERFKLLSSVANNTDIYDILIPWDINRLDEVYDNIVKHVNNKGK